MEAVQVRLIWLDDAAVATTLTGATGATGAAGVVAVAVAESAEVPTALLADTW